MCNSACDLHYRYFPFYLDIIYNLLPSRRQFKKLTWLCYDGHFAMMDIIVLAGGWSWREMYFIACVYAEGFMYIANYQVW